MSSTSSTRPTDRPAPGCVLASTAVLAICTARYRRWHLSWGSTVTEAAGPMPGDDLLEGAHFVATRAISIDAPPERVWPWLVQVGFGRAGFYSYDWLDNVGRRSATDLLAEFQAVVVGDLAAPMAAHVDERTAFIVAHAKRPHELVWAKSDSTWAWLLVPEGNNGTRLLTRLKARYEAGPFLPITVMLMEIGDFPMMRRMLLGLAERAERAERSDN